YRAIGEQHERHVLRHTVGRVSDAALSQDGSLAVTGGDDGEVVIWNAETGQVHHRVMAHGGRVASVRFVGSDDSRVLSAGVDGRARLWRVGDGAFLAEYVAPAGAGILVALAHSQRELVLICPAGAAPELWSLRAIQRVATLSGEGTDVM